MASKAELEKAFKLVRDAESDAVTEVQKLVENFKEKLGKLMEGLPDNSSVNAYLFRAQTSVNSVFGFELTNLRNQYPLPDANSQPAPE